MSHVAGRRWFLTLAVLLGALAARPLHAQSGSVHGIVTDSLGSPLANATVTVEKTTLRTITGSTGRYVLRNVPTGAQVIRARAIGYTAQTATVTVTGAGTADANFTLVRSTTTLAPLEVVVGSRAKHTAAEELAVPVDVYSAEEVRQQGTTETGQILAQLSPSVNVPRQAVTDATEIVRPFTLRGLSPDHTLVLVNGWRRHQTALLNVFANGSAPGSSGVDLNAIPSGAIGRIEVLRDGASTQYGSDAIAGVVNLVLKEGQFQPFLNANGGQYFPGNGYPRDGTYFDLNTGVGLKLGRGSLGLFGQFLRRNPTNRACPDGSVVDIFGVADSVANCRVVIKRNGVPQPNVHWGDGLERDLQGFANLRLPLNESGTTEFYAFGGYSDRDGTGNGFFRKPLNSRNWPEIYPLGFLPEFRPNVIDYSAVGGLRAQTGGWAIDLGASYGYNSFGFNLRNTLNSSLGPSLTVPTAPGKDGILGTADDPGIPNQTSFDAGALKRGEFVASLNLAKSFNVGLAEPLSVAIGSTFRNETYQVIAGEPASYINGYHLTRDSSGVAQGGSSVFQGFAPSDASRNSRNNIGAYADLETNLSRQLLVNAAGRFERYSDFGSRVTAKVAARYQPSKTVVFRGAASTGFRAPGLAQSWYSHTTTAFVNGNLVEIGNFPVTNRASRIFGAKPLKEETSVNLSGGIAFTPQPNLTFTVDYFHIKVNDRILLGATFDGTSDPVVARILADSGLSQIAGVQFPTNALDTKTDGVDLTGNYRIAAGSGSFDITLGVNYTKNRITRIQGPPAILQGTGSTYTSALDSVTINAIVRNRPDWRGNLAIVYNHQRFHALGRTSYYGSFRDGSNAGLETFGAKTLFDTEIGYRFDNINLSVGARNLFNTFPDEQTLAANTNNGTFRYPGSSPFGYNGRYLYTRAELTLGW